MVFTTVDASTPCSWVVAILYSFGPGGIKIDHVKALINEIMAVSTLLSGFSIGMTAKLTPVAIRAYASFLKMEFFGKGSHFCTFDTTANLPGARSIQNLPSWDTVNPSVKNDANAYCSADGCWVGHWQTNHAAKELGFEPCTMTAAEVKAAYPDYWEKIVEEKAAQVMIEMGNCTMTIIMTTVTVITLCAPRRAGWTSWEHCSAHRPPTSSHVPRFSRVRSPT